jgi:TPR repeat protein
VKLWSRAKSVVVGVVVLLALAGGASAGPWEDGMEAYLRGDFPTALRTWRPLAKSGNVKAQFNVGLMYENGMGVPQDDAEAVKWYRRAAEQGLAEAQTNLGSMYETGKGVPQDDAEAVKWYRRAAEQGLAEAQADLGLRYANGKGVTQDVVLAHMWLNIASARGDKMSAEHRDRLTKRMNRKEVARAQELAREWTPKSPATARTR